MRGKKAKALRKLIYTFYGKGASFRERTYVEGHEPAMMEEVEMPEGLVLKYKMFHKNPTYICNGLRRRYQNAKQRIF